MTAEEYFGDWSKVIDKAELGKIMKWLGTIDKSNLCPTISNIFRAFREVSYKDCKVIWIGQDPYPQQGVATGLLFANDKLDNSPSLNVIKEAILDSYSYHNVRLFDDSMVSIAKQGVLLLNSALTCTVGNVGIHYNVWKPFISKLLQNISNNHKSLVYLLFGNQAQTFKQYIQGYIIECYHPAYYARLNKSMPNAPFKEMNQILYKLYGDTVKLYEDTEYGQC